MMTTDCVHYFDLQGHRGARGLLPENTLPAFERAIRIGVTTLELDVGISSDGVVVVSHDRSLNPDITRDAQGQWLVAPILVNSLSLAQVQAHDVGRINPASDYFKRFGTQSSIDGTRMPTLAALFEQVKKWGSQVRFNIETKISPEKPDETVSPEVFATQLLDVINTHGVQERTVIQSFDWRSLAVVQQQAPSIRTAYLTAQQTWTNTILPRTPDSPRWTGAVSQQEHPDVPSMVKAAGGHIWSPYFGDITLSLVKKAQSLGLQVIPWTVNADKDIAAVVSMGVDGLISDYPDRARSLLLTRGQQLPAPGY